MAARRSTRGSCLLALPLILILLLSASLVAGGSVEVACAKTLHPEYCTTVLSAAPESKTADARGLAVLAIRAAAKAGAAVATPTRAALGVITIRGAQWQCMDACVMDFEEAVSHLDAADKGGKQGAAMDDAKFDDVRDYVRTTRKEGVSWNCDACSTGMPDSAKNGLLHKDNDFEKSMAVTAALIEQATGGDAPAPAPAPSSP